METTLVLDVSYAPVRVVSWQEAIVWVLERIVEVVNEYDREIGTANPSWRPRVPSVVRFLKPLPRKRAVRFSRAGVYQRDGGRCQYCGQVVARHAFTYDHVTPRALGGKTDWANVVVSCVPCNQRKGGRTPAQAGMHLRMTPVKPKKAPSLRPFIVYQKGMPEAWRDYLRDAVYWGGELESDESLT